MNTDVVRLNVALQYECQNVSLVMILPNKIIVNGINKFELLET